MPADRIGLAEHRRESERADAHFSAGARKRAAWLGLVVLAAIALLFAALPASAQGTPGGNATLPLLIGQSAGSTSYSVPVQTLLFFTALSFLPAVLLLMTAFTRIVIVLSLLRQAIGTQAAPPNQVVVGLSLFLTFFVMQPVLDQAWTLGLLPMSEGRVSEI